MVLTEDAIAMGAFAIVMIALIIALIIVMSK
jgi:hypothetical protein